jgi:hypothetical protein
MLLSQISNDQCIEFISNNYEKFVWDEYGYELKQWERIAEQRNLPLVSAVIHGKDTIYCYKEKSVLVPFQNEPRDSTIGVHTMGNLVYPDIELRVIVETIGNSEFAFLPLTKVEWLQLENEYSISVVESRFMSLGTSVNDMFTRAQRAYDLRYLKNIDAPTDPSAAPYLALLKYLPNDWQQSAEYTNLQNNDGTLRIDQLDTLIEKFPGKSINIFFGKGIIGQNKDGVGVKLQKPAVLAGIFSKIGHGNCICLFDESYSRVVFINSNYTACVWVRRKF